MQLNTYVNMHLWKHVEESIKTEIKELKSY